MEHFKNNFEKYKNIIDIKPDEYIQALEKGSEGPGVEQIQSEIFKWEQLQAKLKESIVEEIQVSGFNINCKELIRFLIGKYDEIKKKLIELLAKILKSKIKSVVK